MQSLQGYENLEPIHGSEQTVVFRATRSKDGQTVVIKSPSEAYPKPDIIAAYHHEFQLGSNLNHPNIIRYISLESPHDGVAIVLEDMDASELSEAIPSDGFPIETFLPVAIQLADALTAIHAQEVIHHQVAAKNILFNGANNTAKIADFSLATDHAQEIAKRSISKSELLAYCSPEQTGRINRAIKIDLVRRGPCLCRSACTG